MGWTHSYVASLTMGRKKDNECFYTLVQTRWQGCNDSIKMKALARNYHFPPLFFDHLMKWLAGYFFVIICYPSYNHYPFDPSKLEHIILVGAVDLFTYCHR